MNNVAIIKYQYSVVVKSLEKGLIDRNYNVELLNDSVEEIKAVLDKTDVLIIYLQETILDDIDRIKVLLRICDMFKDCNRHAIMIGSVNSHDSFNKAVPTLKDFLWIDRPVDMHILEAEIEKEQKSISEHKQKKKILIIDDDPLYTSMVAQWLRLKYQVETVNSGMQAVSWLATNKVDLILLDYEMPVIDGPKILEMLRTDSATANIPVVFLTGMGTKESVVKVKKYNPQGYVLKTVTRNDLLKTLNDVFLRQSYLGQK